MEKCNVVNFLKEEISEKKGTSSSQTATLRLRWSLKPSQLG
jgi:hypothetical protein